MRLARIWKGKRWVIFLRKNKTMANGAKGLKNNKILLITLEYPPFKGGVANYYSNLAEHSENKIIVLDNAKNKLINPKLPFLKWLPSFISLAKSIAQNKIQHVLVGQILPLGTAAYIFSFFRKIKYSMILHGMDFSFVRKNWRKKILARLILKKARNIICASGYTAGLVKEFLGGKYEEKVKVVNPGISQCQMSNVKCLISLNKKYKLEKKIVLLSVGRLVKRKGVDQVLDVLPDVLKKIPNLEYLIIGKGDEINNYKLIINNLNLKDNVRIIEDANDEERDALYGLADIFVLPTREIKGDFEGFGIVYLEANLHGLPVIAGNSGGASDAVVDGVSGLLIEAGDKEELKKAILKLAQNKDLREKLGSQGRERVLREFRWEDKAKLILNLISS